MTTDRDHPATAAIGIDGGGFGASTATFVVMSSMIGVGILTTSGFAVVGAGSNALALALWVLGGLLALCGALTLAEVAAALPRSGGEYVYLRAAYGPLAGFVAGWVSFFLGFAAPMAATASAASSYLLEPFAAPAWVGRVVASAAILGFAAVQATGRKATAGAQGLVSGLTLGLLVLFVAAGLIAGRGRFGHLNDWPTIDGATLTQAASSLVYISYAYTGWNAATYIAGEVGDPGRRLPRAILGGTALVIALYLGMNVVYALGFGAKELRELAESRGLDAVEPIAALAAGRLFGDRMASGLAVTFGLVLLASLSALLVSGSRVIAAMAEDGLFPAIAARRSAGDGSPAAALWLLVGVALVLLWTGTFAQLVVFSSVGLSLFSMAAISTVFVLRRARPDLPRPFRTPGYPIVPLAYLAGGGVLVAVALADAEKGPPALLATLVILAGAPVYWAGRRGRRTARSN